METTKTEDETVDIGEITQQLSDMQRNVERLAAAKKPKEKADELREIKDALTDIQEKLTKLDYKGDLNSLASGIGTVLDNLDKAETKILSALGSKWLAIIILLNIVLTLIVLAAVILK